MNTTIPIEIFPIEDDGFHLRLTCTINGKEASLILDTGASRTVFDEGRIAAFIDGEEIEEQDRLSTGLGTNSMESKQTVLQRFGIGEICVNSYNAAVLDLTHVNQSYERLKITPIDGVLGGDILNNYKAVIDYHNSMLILTQQL